MTSASTERCNVKDCAILRKGLAANITVLNWNGVKDNNTLKDTAKAPTEIEAVFLNGRQIQGQGKGRTLWPMRCTYSVKAIQR